MIAFFTLDWLCNISRYSILTKCLRGKISNYFCGERNEEKEKYQE